MLKNIFWTHITLQIYPVSLKFGWNSFNINVKWH